ncbi:hypothetical protein CS022_09440 [Veronia nyctiphanis]|uniref:DUF3624 domain-containing protein n=1 Tax=Veronia nyctiphanis TaxID=1278244 RepID=A0A4Q0YWQ2_9GAMM|nr:DUF3624 domain-containing protein [Veronia nyctiphanis]RXJ73461.1 hypothetical protein CS022_09440 [Veronia nyctiphanis]
MTCQYCDRRFGSFSDKIGRCTRCMMQLALMNALLWPLWWWFFRDSPKTVESIALLFACVGSVGLLLLHLLLFPFRRKGKSKVSDRSNPTGT